jgi:hypothetical protein
VTGTAIVSADRIDECRQMFRTSFVGQHPTTRDEHYDRRDENGADKPPARGRHGGDQKQAADLAYERGHQRSPSGTGAHGPVAARCVRAGRSTTASVHRPSSPFGEPGP